MASEEIISLLILLSCTAVIIGIIIIILFLVFQKRKAQLIQEKRLAEQRLLQEIANAQIEIKEATLRNISWELHDNIGQLLSVAKIQLNHIKGQKEAINEVSNTLSKSIQELRALSKTSNPEYLEKINLVEALDLEINRFNRLNFIKGTLEIKGALFELNKNTNLIVFRIIQEFFSNAIKHSKATELTTILDYTTDFLYITVSDNGIGFDVEKNQTEGIGLMNIKNRVKLINAQSSLTSVINKGTQLTIKIPKHHETLHSNR